MNNEISLELSAYNSLKAEAIRSEMIIDHLFRTAQSTVEGETRSLTWNQKQLSEILELVYPKRYANKLAEFEEKSELEDLDQHQ